jgi:hypothetical protein
MVSTILLAGEDHLGTHLAGSKRVQQAESRPVIWASAARKIMSIQSEESTSNFDQTIRDGRATVFG